MGHKRKFIVLNAYLKNLEKSHTSKLLAHHKALKQKETKPLKRSRWQEYKISCIHNIHNEIVCNLNMKKISFTRVKYIFCIFREILLERTIFSFMSGY